MLSSRSGYGLTRSVVVERIRHLLGLPTISMQRPDIVANALLWYETGMDFADALHLASSLDVDGFATFEKRIPSQAERFQLHHPVYCLSFQQYS